MAQMKKLAFAFTMLGAAAALLAPPTAAAPRVSLRYMLTEMATEWIGVAASPNGRVYGVTNQSSEAVARNAAKFACEQETGRTCAAIAVPMSWDVVVMTCGRPGRLPVPIVAGSGQNAALQNALYKAIDAGVDPYTCREIYSY
jgi:hypothetical protein